VAAGFSLSCFCLILFVWVTFGGTVPLAAHGYRVHVSFDQAANLTSNEDVRIAGVTVGKVTKVTPSQGRTDALLELSPEYVPLASDARAILRSKTLLGEAFVQLTPGSRSAPKLPENGYLSVGNVMATQQVDQVLGSFDQTTRDNLKRFTAEFSSALRGRGADVNAALGNAAPAVDDLSKLVSILDQQGADVQRLISGAGVALRSVAARGTALRRLVGAGDQVFAATAARNRELTATVRALPPFLAQLRPTLSAVEQTAVEAAPTLHTLRPVAPLVGPALSGANRLAPQLTHAFRELLPILNTARTAVPALIKLVADIRPVTSALDPFMRQVVPIGKLADLYQRDTIASLANTAAALEGTTPLPGGGTQHYLRTLLPLVNEGYAGIAQRFPTNRDNPYPAPGARAGLARGALPAFDCSNTASRQPAPILPALGANSGAPPCITQAPWSFQGTARSYPHVEPLRP
jgi:virulence factor Mce-like protein